MAVEAICEVPLKIPCIMYFVMPLQGMLPHYYFEISGLKRENKRLPHGRQFSPLLMDSQ